MSIVEIATLLSSLGALTASAVALFKAWRTTPADVAGRYQEIADRAAQRIAVLERAIEELKKENDQLCERFNELEELARQYYEGSQRLFHQIKANNLTPVWSPPQWPRKEE